MKRLLLTVTAGLLSAVWLTAHPLPAAAAAPSANAVQPVDAR